MDRSRFARLPALLLLLVGRDLLLLIRGLPGHDLLLGGEPLRLRQLLVLQVEPRNKAAALVLVNDAPLDDLEIT